MTQRDMQAELSAYLDGDFVVEVIFLELLFDTDPIRVHTDVGTIVADGRDAAGATVAAASWLGVGDLGTIGVIEQADILSPFAVEATLSIIDESAGSLIEEINTQDWRNRPANIYFGARDYVDGSLVNDLELLPLMYGRIDTFETTDGADVSLATVRVESNLREFKKSSLLRFSDATQQARYPGDLGMQYVAKMVNNTVRWGTDETVSFGQRSTGRANFGAFPNFG